MADRSHIARIVFHFLLVLAVVIAGSGLANYFWGGEEERRISLEEIVLVPEMSVGEFARQNNIPGEVLWVILRTAGVADTGVALNRLPVSEGDLRVKTRTAIVQYEEEHSKNPVRFTIHFIVALIFLSYILWRLQTNRLPPRYRNSLYLVAAFLFGFGFSSNPSPMGPLRDTMALFGNLPEILHPRLWAILTFLLLVVVANKLICSWACQLGVLQDYLFRLNRNGEDNQGILRQYKIPFALTNGIRIGFFVLMSGVSFVWAFPLLNWADPFFLFDPLEMTAAAGGVIVFILVASVFVYRPWCHLVCPFGLVGWAVERYSLYKIRVDEDRCTRCNACIPACPSDAMEAILEQRPTLPDCYSCGTCMNECPEGAIGYRKSIVPQKFRKLITPG